MSKRDDFLKEEYTILLQPEEEVLNTATAFTGPSLKKRFLMFIFGNLFLTSYFAVLTNKRLLLIKTKMGVTGVKTENHGVTEYLISNIEQISWGGVLNQKTLTLVLKDGNSKKIQFNTVAAQIIGQKAFCTVGIKRLHQLIPN